MRNLLLLLVLAANGSAAFADDDYFPAAVGQKSLMAAKVTTPDGKILTGDASQTFEGSVQKNGKTYFRDHFLLPLLEMDFTKLVRRDDKGAYSMDADKGDAVEQTEAIFPLKVGASWQDMSDGRTMTTTIIGFESVEIAEKTYGKCCHLRTTTSDGNYTADDWEAPGLGEVKSEVVFKNGLKVTLTLKQFTPGK
jgi:hypothetical protein